MSPDISRSIMNARMAERLREAEKRRLVKETRLAAKRSGLSRSSSRRIRLWPPVAHVPSLPPGTEGKRGVHRRGRAGQRKARTL